MKKKSYKIYITTTALLLYFFIAMPTFSFASDTIGNWSETASLPNTIASHISQVYNNALYVIGGANSEIVPENLSSVINNDSSLQAWSSSTPSPSILWHASIINNNNIYLLGGDTNPPSVSSDAVYLGSINQTGKILDWKLISHLPEHLALGSAVIFGNKIYFAGGFDTSNTNQNQIYSSPINTEGTLGNWTLAGTLPEALSGFGLVANGNNLVVIGGEDANNQDQSGVYTAPVNPDGSIGTWKTTAQLPQPVYRGSTVKIGSKVVSIGGSDNGIALEEVYYADLNPDGTVGNWQTSSSFLPQPICCSAASATDNYIYLTGGYSPNAGYLDTVYYAKINKTNDLSVPLVKQTSNPWQSQEYDSAHVWNPSNTTINAWGCALTSAVMIFRYYGINELPDGTLLDPGSLNTWLKNQPDGYVGTGWVNWLALSRLSKLAVGINNIVAFDALEYNRVTGANKTQLTTDLNNGHPDILEEPGHFIVGKGINDTTFDINDPYYSRNTLNDGYNNNFLSLGQYTPSQTDLSYLMFVTDPNTTINVTNSKNISVGSSFIQAALKNPLNTKNTNTPIKIYYLPKPDSGNYTITASNTNILWQLTAYFYDQQGNPKLQTLKGFGNASFQLNFDKSTSSNSVSKKIVTFDSIIQDIKDASNLHFFNNALALGLITIVKNAQTQAAKHPEVSKGLLAGGITLLNANQAHPILLSPDTYTILLEDLTTLINSL